ncbi:Os06g0263000 [Oryza sativa Japonica Group]|uniref:Os06g0263000 protein n=1 Tax=Oryza sativa subsp. japonica TaxID=39947 RepID=A0A0N7KLW2_ORYSJ|nr:Os06g0263000 [Oryza sativa Japonica Group]
MGPCPSMQQLRPAVLHLAMQIHTTGTAQEASGLLFSVVLLDVNEPDVAATTRMVIDARWRVALVGVENLHAQIVLYMEIVDG